MTPGYIRAMASPLRDTDPDILQRMSALYARMTPAQKLARVRDLTLAVNALALAGLRARHPHEQEGQLLLRLARRRLGEDLTAKAYPPQAGP
jgi:hypothetical protein